MNDRVQKNPVINAPQQQSPKGYTCRAAMAASLLYLGHAYTNGDLLTIGRNGLEAIEYVPSMGVVVCLVRGTTHWVPMDRLQWVEPA